MLKEIKKYCYSIAEMCLKDGECDWQKLNDFITISDNEEERENLLQEIQYISSDIENIMAELHEANQLTKDNLAQEICKLK